MQSNYLRIILLKMTMDGGLVDNPNFRAVWFGTNKLFLNSVFFGQIIKAGTAD
jgi:hypothetical protein